jgi:serine incorporator 1/3
MGSLMSACCGNDKASTIAPGAASGRKRSVLLLVLSIAIAFAFQYFVADFITKIAIPNYVTDAWTEGCDKYETELYVKRCVGQAGVFRSSASSTLFFILAAIGVACKRSANREAWPAKYALFLFLVLGTCFVPNDPIFLTVYLNIARVGAVFYIFVQQIILIDLAHNWNDSWVGRGDKAESEERGSGRKWLGAILVSAGIMFSVSIVGISLLYHFYAGCSNNTTFITVTLLMCLIITGTQLSGEEGSLLASSVISLYATSLCYSAGACNSQYWSMVSCSRSPHRGWRLQL